MEVTYLGPGEYIYLSFAGSEDYEFFRVYRLGDYGSQEVNASVSLPATTNASGTWFVEHPTNRSGEGNVTVLLAGTDPAQFSQKFRISGQNFWREGMPMFVPVS